jgi:hypothetical protein
MLEMLISRPDILITSFCTIFATAIGVILGHLLQSIGKLRLYHVDYVLKLNIINPGYYTPAQLTDKPNGIIMESIIDINNTSHKSKLIKNIAIKIQGNKIHYISTKNEIRIMGDKNITQNSLIINPMETKRIIINAYFNNIDVNIIDKNSSIIALYSGEKNRQKRVFICKMLYYNFRESKIFL